MKVINLIVLSVFIFAHTGCDETKKVIDAAGNVQLSGEYEVSSVKEKAVTTELPSITFAAMDKSVNGYTGCNRFFGNYNLDLYALTFIDISATEIACGEEIMDTERNFLDALYNTGSYALEEDILVLYSKNDRSVMLRAKKVRPENN